MAIRRKPVRVGRGRGEDQGRGLIDEHGSQTPSSGFGDTEMQVSPPHESAEGHPLHEASGPIHSMAELDSQGAAPTASSSTTVKNRRGKAKCKKLSYYVDKNGPLYLNIPHNHRAPIGNNASWFASKLGEIVRNMCELHHDDWTAVPAEEKARLFCHVRSYFELQMDMHEHTSAIQNKLGRAYARIRSNLYRHNYKKHFKGIDANDAEAIAKAKDVVRKTLPKGYQSEQWKQICDSFDKKSWKTKSIRNTRNRNCLQTNHTSGTCTFVNFIYKKEQQTRVKPNRVELYEYTHKKKDGEFVTPRCKTLYEEMKEKTSNVAMEEDTVEGRSVEDRIEEVVTQVLGGPRSGHVRGMGYGLIPTRSTSNKEHLLTQNNNQDEWKIKAEQMESELQQSRLEHQQTKEALRENVAQTQKLQATVDLLLARLGGSEGCLSISESSGANN